MSDFSALCFNFLERPPLASSSPRPGCHLKELCVPPISARSLLYWSLQTRAPTKRTSALMKSRRGGLFSANLHPRMVSHEPKLFPGVVHGSPNAAAFEADASMHLRPSQSLGMFGHHGLGD